MKSMLSLGRYGLRRNTDLLYNEKNIFPNLIPWRMDAPSYKAALENGKGIKLSSGKQKKLETLNASKLEALKQCILENKMEIEQEMLI